VVVGNSGGGVGGVGSGGGIVSHWSHGLDHSRSSVVSHWGNGLDHSRGGVVSHWSHGLHDGRGGVVGHRGGGVGGIGSGGGVVGDGSGNGLHNRGNGDGLDQGLTVHDGVESVDGVGGVLDGPLVAIGVDQGVLSADHVTVALLHLALGVSGEGILDIVGVLVLGMGVVEGHEYYHHQ